MFLWPVGGTDTLNVLGIVNSTVSGTIDMVQRWDDKDPDSNWSTGNQTFTPGTGTIIWNDAGGNSTLPSAITTYNNLTIDVSGRTATLGVAITVNGNLTITAGTLSASSSDRDITLKGNWSNNVLRPAGTVTFSGTTAQSIGGSTTTTFRDLTIANASATVSGAVNFNVSHRIDQQGLRARTDRGRPAG